MKVVVAIHRFVIENDIGTHIGSKRVSRVSLWGKKAEGTEN